MTPSFIYSDSKTAPCTPPPPHKASGSQRPNGLKTSGSAGTQSVTPCLLVILCRSGVLLAQQAGYAPHVNPQHTQCHRAEVRDQGYSRQQAAMGTGSVVENK